MTEYDPAVRWRQSRGQGRSNGGPLFQGSGPPCDGRHRGALSGHVDTPSPRRSQFSFHRPAAGGGARDLPPVPPHISDLTAEPVREFITAGKANQTVPARSVFAPAFVDAIGRGLADLDKDGYVTGTELGLYLQRVVPQFGRQNPQYGKIADYLLARGDFVFALGAATAPPEGVRPKPGPQPGAATAAARLRRTGGMAAFPPDRGREMTRDFQVGEAVLATWENESCAYPAKVVEVGADSVRVLYSFSSEARVPFGHVFKKKLIPPGPPAQKLSVLVEVDVSSGGGKWAPGKVWTTGAVAISFALTPIARPTGTRSG